MSNEIFDQTPAEDQEFEQLAAAEQTMIDESVSAEDREIMEMLAADEAAAAESEKPQEETQTAIDAEIAPAAPVVPEPAAPVSVETMMQLLVKQQETINALLATVQSAAAKTGGSGSKARPNAMYKLLKRPVAWAKTPQVAQLQQIIFDNPEKLTLIPEPKLFEMLEAAKLDGRLRTTQPAARIFQYYRAALVGGDYIQQL